jgi:hypothetical protein
MKDVSLISNDTLHAVAAKVQTEAADTNILQSIAAREPLLAAFVADKLLTISGKLSLSGAPPEIVRGSYEDVATLVVTAVRAVWAGSDELWHGIELAHIARSATTTPAAADCERTAVVPAVENANESIIADPNIGVIEGNCRLAAYRVLAAGKTEPRRRARRRGRKGGGPASP